MRVTDDVPLDWDAVWSPDGTHLYFASDRGGSMNVWKVAIDEESGRVLGAPEPLTTPSRWSGHLALSADGKKLVFGARDDRSNIEKLDIDFERAMVAGTPAPVTSGTMPITQPRVSPDGSWIVFRTRGQQEDLFVIRPDGTDLRQLTNDAFKDRGPAWSPDGRRIVFYSNRSGRYEVWTVQQDGSNLQQVTVTTGRSQWFPRFSPDARWIAVRNESGTSLVDLTGPLPAHEMQSLPPLGHGSIVFAGSEWSSDGRALLGTRSSVPTFESDAIVVYRLDSGTYEVVLEMPRISVEGPVWLGDGRRILYTADGKLYEVDLADRKPVEIRGMPQDVEIVGVSVHARTLYYVRQTREADLWLAKME